MTSPSPKLPVPSGPNPDRDLARAPLVAPRSALLALLATLILAAPVTAQPGDGIDLLRLAGAGDYRAWMGRNGWEDLRPLSDPQRFESARRFRIEEKTLRLASSGDASYIGSDLPGILPLPLAEHRYLRFVVRIDRVPEDADVGDNDSDDAAFRIYAVTRTRPIQSVVYVWSWSLPVGEWSALGFTGRGLYNNVRRKAFGRGPPIGGQWLTVEVDLLADFQSQFPEYSDPQLKALHLKSDSNDVRRARGIARLRSVTLHRTSLRETGAGEGDLLGDTVLWYR